MTRIERNRQMRELTKQLEVLANTEVEPERPEAFYERIADERYGIWEKGDNGLHEKVGIAYGLDVVKRMTVSKELLALSKEVADALKKGGWFPAFVERYRILIDKAEGRRFC